MIIAGVPFFIFWIWKKEKYAFRKIQKIDLNISNAKKEVFYSLFSIAIFTLFIRIIYSLNSLGYTKIYTNIDDFGFFYYLLSLPILLVVHDAYFYFTHRMMHHKLLFKVFHKVHHNSTDPTPLAAFSFHPLETIVEGGIFFLIAFLIPVHLSMFFIFVILSLVLNVKGHLGYEFFPRYYLRNKYMSWFLPTTHHNMHHKYYNSNYGLYFSWWDKILKTEHRAYQEMFEKNRVNPLTSIIASMYNK
jgi:sterol desaturase/sphingolipid hydroxylase (fatty acid hydroxylase superfamily)